MGHCGRTKSIDSSLNNRRVGQTYVRIYGAIGTDTEHGTRNRKSSWPANRHGFPLQSTPTFDESKMSFAAVVTQVAEVIKIEQNVLEAAETARKSRTHEVFDGKP